MRLDNDIQDAVAGLVARWEDYAFYQAWYDGHHDVRSMLERMPIRNEKFKQALCGLSENLCPLVVDALADRLQLEGIEAPGQEDNVSAILKRARIDAFQGEVHKRTATQGDGYVLVWQYPNDRARFYYHDGAEMAVIRDPERPEQLRAAVKMWSEKDGANKERVRLTIYRPDRIERLVKYRNVQQEQPGVLTKVWNLFFGRSDVPKDWDEYTEDGAPVLPNPLGVVPVAVFNNGRYRAHGRSELANVIGPQRMLNKTLVDLALGSEAHGIPNRYIVGIDWDTDPETGLPRSAFKPTDPIWAFGAKPDEMAFGQFQAANLVQMAEGSVQVYRESIARVSRTPLHYLGDQKGGWPSGEALKTAEAAFTAKVEERQREYGEPWEDAIRFALMFEQGVPSDYELEAKWRDTRPRAEYEYWQGQEIQQRLGKSKREIWTEEGYSKEEIDRMLGESRDEATQAAEATANSLARSFASGGQVRE